jgi:hypothetical protein
MRPAPKFWEILNFKFQKTKKTRNTKKQYQSIDFTPSEEFVFRGYAIIMAWHGDLSDIDTYKIAQLGRKELLTKLVFIEFRVSNHRNQS